MADDYVRETLRTLRERTGDAYVPLSEVVSLIGDRSWDQMDLGRTGEAYRLQALAGEIVRRWGPGPQCERCDGKGYWGGDGIKTACVVCDCGAARGPVAELDSPNFTPQELRDFKARGYERRHRRG